MEAVWSPPVTLDPRCKRRWFSAAPHDFEILSQGTIVNTAAKEILSRTMFALPDLIKTARPKLVITFKCRLCGAIKQTEHTP